MVIDISWSPCGIKIPQDPSLLLLVLVRLMTVLLQCTRVPIGMTLTMSIFAFCTLGSLPNFPALSNREEEHADEEAACRGGGGGEWNEEEA